MSLWKNNVNADTKPSTLENEFSANETGSEGKAKFVRNAQEENTMKIAPSENDVYLEKPASGERNTRE